MKGLLEQYKYDLGDLSENYKKEQQCLTEMHQDVLYLKEKN